MVKPDKNECRPATGAALSKPWLLRRSCVALVVFVAGLLCVGNIAAQAQSSGSGLGQLLQGLAPDLQQKLQGIMGGQSGGAQTPVPLQQPVILTPAPVAQGSLSPSQLEMLLSARLGQEVDQFGYNQVGVGAPVVIPQAGAVQDSYVLGPGDTLDISLRGGDGTDETATVDRNGQVVLPKLPPIPAAGRTLGDFRRDLANAVHRIYVGTQVYVTVDQLRQVAVLVAGEIANPGVRVLTASSTPLDAILLSGGISKAGSLRNIKLVRDNRVIDIDLYDVLMRQSRGQLTNLRDGDRILVPPIGATVAIAGSVNRPGIFELAPGRKTITERELMEYAAGLTLPGSYKMSLLRQMSDGTRRLVDISNQPGAIIHDGEGLLVRSAVDISLNRVTMVGAVRTPGAFALGTYRTLHDLLPSPNALLPGAYVLLGIVERTDSKTLEHEAIAFSPLHVMEGTENLDLVSDDKIHILTEAGMQCLVQTIALVVPTDTQVSMAAQARQASSDVPVQTNNGPLGNPAGLNTTSSNPLSACAYPITMPGGQQVGGQVAPQNAQQAANMQTPNGALSVMMPGQQTQIAPSYMSTSSMVAALAGGGAASGSQIPGQAGGTTPLASTQGLGNLSPALAPGLANLLNPSGAQQGTTGYGQQPMGYGQQPQIPSGPYLPGTTTPYVPGYPGATLPGAAPPAYASPTTPYYGNGAANPTMNPYGIQNGMAAALPQDLGGYTTDDALFFARALSQYQVTITGAVQEPGILMVAPNTTLAEALVGTHGFDVDTDLSNFEVTSVNINNLAGYARTQRKSYRGTQQELAAIDLKPFDTVIFHHVFADRALEYVSIEGEVRYPGSYNIMRGEHLSTLLARAGGLTDEAYTYGTVFLRQSVARREQKAFKEEAADIRSQMFDALIRPVRATSTQTPPSPEAFTALSNMLSQIEQQPALGRVAYIADPTLLKAHPDRDPILEPGDAITIPKRPSSVSVLGEVMQPGTVPYNPKFSVDEYIERVGGESQFADSSGTIIILPDGTAHRAGDSTWLSFGRSNIPPGSVIMVPRDLTSLRVEDLIVDSTQIFAQLATMTAALSLLATYK